MALYFLVTGSIWQGVLLAAYGVLVIGLVDNILRPILVGKDTKMPDYVVLITTLGGIAVFGLVGFVVGPVIAALFIAVWEVVAGYRANPQDAPAGTGVRSIRTSRCGCLVPRVRRLHGGRRRRSRW